MLLHTARLSMRPDTPLGGSNARGAKYMAYYMGTYVERRVFENKMAALSAVSGKKRLSQFLCLFPVTILCDIVF